MVYDLCVIGGGINGVGIANDAAGRGLSVILCEQGDLAQGTSSASSKLIHGGLRYLEMGEFKLVRQALLERDILYRKAPHLIQPMTFVLPHSLRATWLVRLGLFLYDHLAISKIFPKSKKINLTDSNYGKILAENYQQGFTYADGFVDDARLVIVNAKQASQQGAKICTHSKVLAISKHDKLWQIKIQNNKNIEQVFARAVVNAAGPWVEQLTQPIANYPTRLIKGSHIVVPKLYAGDQAYLLQNPDRRVIFAIPFQQQFTLIGTTDVEYQGRLDDVTISTEERDYLINASNLYFKKSISAHDIVWSYAGVRSLQNEQVANPAKISRDYSVHLDEIDGAPLLTVVGGKITTYRILAEQALAKLQKYFPHMRSAWTAKTPLPGGAITSLTQLQQQLANDFPEMPKSLLDRYARTYGTDTYPLLKNIKSIADCGQHFGAGLYAHEITYLRTTEWAQSVEDIVWRRTKLGLLLNTEQLAHLNDFLKTFSE